MSTQIEQQVNRIAMSREYVERKLSLGPNEHDCKWDTEGRCMYCPKRLADARLKAGARTGELSWD